MGKASRLTTLLHSSGAFKDAFEKGFGKDKSIPTANSTRWNSVLHQLSSIVTLDHQKLSNICNDTNHGEAVLTVREWAHLNELVDILQPFAEATSLTQGDKVPTISLVIPTVLALNRHLTSYSRKAKYLKGVITALQASLHRRYLGIFTNFGMSSEPEELVNIHPFGDAVYLLAAVVDPSFALHWMVDVNVSDGAKDRIRTKLKGKFNTLQ